MYVLGGRGARRLERRGGVIVKMVSNSCLFEGKADGGSESSHAHLSFCTYSYSRILECASLILVSCRICNLCPAIAALPTAAFYCNYPIFRLFGLSCLDVYACLRGPRRRTLPLLVLVVLVFPVPSLAITVIVAVVVVAAPLPDPLHY